MCETSCHFFLIGGVSTFPKSNSDVTNVFYIPLFDLLIKVTYQPNKFRWFHLLNNNCIFRARSQLYFVG